MKFGQELERSQVPEWKAQYLDYKKGKKKLKKVGKVAALSSSSVRSKNTPSLSINALRRQSSDGAVRHESSLSSVASLSLPPPAIPPSVKQHNPSTSSSDYAKKPNDKTPLLLATDQAASSTHSQEESLESLDSTEHSPGPVQFKSLTYNGSNSSPLTLERRRSAVGKLYDNFKRSRIPSLSTGSPDDIPLEPIAEYARSDFLNWVDKELAKIEQFYREREEASAERFEILNDQVFYLKHQKQRRSQKRQTLRSAVNANEGSSGNNEESDDELDEERLDRLAGIRYELIYAEHTAKRAIGWLNNFETPSFPRFKWLQQGGKEKQYYEDDDDEPIDSSPREDTRYNGRDYSKNKVPYLVARRQIKTAMLEYYRSLELLKSYKLLNKTAFRKMLKKFDKTTGSNIQAIYMEKVNNAYFWKSEVIDNLLVQTETLYSETFAHGNRKMAIARLRSTEAEKTYYAPFFSSGLLLGIGIPFFVLAVYLGTYKTVSGQLEAGKYILQIWAGFAITIFMALLFGINCYIWTIYKINYKFIFEFDQRTALDVKEFFFLPSLMFGAGSMFAWFGFSDFWPNQIACKEWPWFFVGISLGIMFCPLNTFYRSSRIWILTAIWRLLLSGFYPVEFRDFFIGDILCSLTYSISNISLFLCLYSTHWRNTKEAGPSTRCGSSKSRVMGFLSTVPSLMRFMQCLRRYADTGDWFPHLANMAKYTISAVYYITLSVYRITTTTPNRAILITFASVNSIYSSIWDIFMDWSLMQAGSKHRFLRNDLIFKNPWYYYSAMIVDVILRFQWIFYALFTEQIQQSAVTSFGIALAELLRRFIWIFFRMENEHCTNVHLFRASRETPLPYPVIPKRPSPVRNPSTDTEAAGEGSGDTSAPQRIVKRRSTMFPQFLEHASNIINKAHIKDFQRKKVDQSVPEPNDDSSDEDEDDDEDDVEQIDNAADESSTRHRKSTPK